ncbi:phosphocholine cytidylyltransferase family protein [Agarivorans sp. TSD2052]|uniref:phosphocholine cytidylyltransferase family protein n=1 Tax=Agarivorans sp. TSD2052 TaxID=2937286 RepID=UPI00200F3EB1|nr:phosphocholine cytidylyltransferase family protein [Agarivorans sp. TSD2052]UPW20170.1 phosphocholine cytidylyltransferase family protein [Agarivorans sp. TSD2052]
MRALILASGRGSRLGELTAKQPKCFTPVAQKRLVEWQKLALSGAGINQLAVTTGYFSDSFKPLFEKRFHNPLWASSNMVYSMLQAKNYIAEESCIISYSDIVYSADAVKRLQSCHDDIAIAYDPKWLSQWQARYENPLDDAESFSMQQGYLTDIGRKVNNLDEINGQYMGLLKFTVNGWQQVLNYLNQLSHEQLAKLDMTSLLQGLIKAGHSIAAVAIADEWFEVDTLEDLLVAEQQVANFSWNQ